MTNRTKAREFWAIKGKAAGSGWHLYETVSQVEKKISDYAKNSEKDYELIKVIESTTCKPCIKQMTENYSNEMKVEKLEARIKALRDKTTAVIELHSPIGDKDLSEYGEGARDAWQMLTQDLREALANDAKEEGESK